MFPDTTMPMADMATKLSCIAQSRWHCWSVQGRDGVYSIKLHGLIRNTTAVTGINPK